MRIWKLTPADPAAPIWKDWSPEPVFVRAVTEEDARRLAQQELAILKTVPGKWGEPKPFCPWITQESGCVDVTGQVTEFPAAGQPAVLRHGEKF